MDLSVIIVNYNVKHFLEQCLISTIKASKSVDCEIIVVDNYSLDGSIEMVKRRFPEVKLIESKINLGFSKGNNLGIEKAQGEFILLLNPDTLVEEDTFEKVVGFMKTHPDAGGLGVKMMDGKGRFLPESKRGLPTPRVAFYKMFGLSRLFPKTKLFGQYHLSYLDQDKTHKVDVLSGAFMLLRKSVLDKIGLLDETFFMYGEDIDLSYRIKLGGFENYYFPETQIIHYKGESTKKTSVNYVFVFYRAMAIFANKHFSKKNARLFGSLINLAIYFRASITLLGNVLRRGYIALLDFLLILVGLYLIMLLHNHYTGVNTPSNIYEVFFPLFALVWVVSIFFSAGYDKPILLKNYTSGSLGGLIVILLLYSLLPEDYRFSRAIVLLGGGSTLLLGLGIRILMNQLNVSGFELGRGSNKRLAIVGSQKEIERVRQLLSQTNIESNFVANVAASLEGSNSDFFIGHLGQLKEISEIFKIDEIIFCAENISSTLIINQMGQLDDERIDFKIAPPDSLFVIGSNSINTPGELYSVMNINSIKKPSNRRYKRLVDVLFSLLFLALSPLMVFITKHPFQFFSNLFSVLFGLKSLVGYSPNGENVQNLPAIKPGILAADSNKIDPTTEQSARLNIFYAKDYKVWNDVRLIMNNMRRLSD